MATKLKKVKLRKLRLRQKNGIPESATDAKRTQAAKMANKCINEKPKSPVIPKKVSKVKQMKDKFKVVIKKIIKQPKKVRHSHVQFVTNNFQANKM